VGLRFEPFVGGRFLEVYDEATGEGFEIGRVTDWQPGRRLAYTWREHGWAPEEQCEVDADRLVGSNAASGASGSAIP
jgi:uncharacterized protein YndB with AHSA1/START domain